MCRPLFPMHKQHQFSCLHNQSSPVASILLRNSSAILSTSFFWFVVIGYSRSSFCKHSPRKATCHSLEAVDHEISIVMQLMLKPAPRKSRAVQFGSAASTIFIQLDSLTAAGCSRPTLTIPRMNIRIPVSRPARYMWLTCYIQKRQQEIHRVTGFTPYSRSIIYPRRTNLYTRNHGLNYLAASTLIWHTTAALEITRCAKQTHLRTP